MKGKQNSAGDSDATGIWGEGGDWDWVGMGLRVAENSMKQAAPARLSLFPNISQWKIGKPSIGDKFTPTRNP